MQKCKFPACQGMVVGITFNGWVCSDAELQALSSGKNNRPYLVKLDWTLLSQAAVPTSQLNLNNQEGQPLQED